MKLSEIILGLLRIPTDFLLGLLGFFVAYQIRSKTDLIPGIELPLDLTSFPPLNEYLLFAASVTTILILILAFNRLYSLKIRTSTGKEIGKIISSTLIWLMLIIAYFFVIRAFPFSRLALAYAWLLTTMFIISGRLFIRLIELILNKFNIGRFNLLFIGNNQFTTQIAKKLKKNPRYKIMGFVDGQDQNNIIPFLGHIEKLEEIIKKQKIDEIIQTKSNIETEKAESILEFCRENHIRYSFVPDVLAMHKTNIDIEVFDHIPVIKMKPTPLDGWGRVAKRITDFILALFGLIVLSPLLLLTAIAIKLDSKGTILFKYLDDGSRVKRVGQYGKLFNFFKFRSMHPNTHNLRYTKLSENNTRKESPLVKIKNDPRVTRVGKFIRRTSIDELPQLWNVIKGEMSLVGPRPHLPEEVANYKKHHKFVLTVKPGITGLAQISGRSDLDFEEEVRLDTYYIENWSIWKDFYIIFKTIFVIFKNYNE
ncbi:exopolysaccharide biosynthesis polyprenyl glycosylphosphotransferase [Candidatus Peregrinibacteria bacterium]|nr:exopolysaccharide biosynthesis polyprenyl glycosylphosphotransferase [Candidatus Peregrinibacteria bacterium]